MKALELADMIERYNNGIMSQAIYEDYLKAASELRRLAVVEAELERIKQDAARYRWLRERVSVLRVNDEMFPLSWFPFAGAPVSATPQDETDAAIDADIAAQKKGNSVSSVIIRFIPLTDSAHQSIASQKGANNG